VDEETGAATANIEDAPQGFFISGSLPVGDDQGVHSLVDVQVFSYGPGHELFNGSPFFSSSFHLLVTLTLHLSLAGMQNSVDIGLKIARAVRRISFFSSLFSYFLPSFVQSRLPSSSRRTLTFSPPADGPRARQERYLLRRRSRQEPQPQVNSLPLPALVPFTFPTIVVVADSWLASRLFSLPASSPSLTLFLPVLSCVLSPPKGSIQIEVFCARRYATLDSVVPLSSHLSQMRTARTAVLLLDSLLPLLHSDVLAQTTSPSSHRL
jgi:hypothetical protein